MAMSPQEYAAPPYPLQPYPYAPLPQQQQQSNTSVVVVGGAAPVAQNVVVKQRSSVNHWLHCCISVFFFPWIFVWIYLCFCDECEMRSHEPQCLVETRKPVFSK